MRVALGILNKEIERLQVEIDFMPTIQSNPERYARLTAEIEELLNAWQVLKDWKRPKGIDLSKFFMSSEHIFGEELISKDSNGKYDHCRCVSTDPTDVTLCDKCPDKKETYGPAQEIDTRRIMPFNQEKADMVKRCFSVRNEGDRFDPDQKEIPLKDTNSYIEP